MSTDKKHQTEKISPALLVANITLLAFVISFSLMVYQSHRGSRTVSVVPPAPSTNTHMYDNLALHAKSVYVLDVSTGKVLYAKDAQTPRPLASLTKVMTAITALSLLPKNTTITVTKDFLSEEGDSGLYVNERWSFKNLLDFSLLVSSNDGMRSIASVAGAFGLPQTGGQPNYGIGLKDFITKMNTLSTSLDLKTMKFNNETGLDISSNEDGGVGSAEDMTHLMQYALTKYPDLMEVTRDQTLDISSLDKKHIAKNTDTVISDIPDPIASKTGYTDNAGGNLVVAFDAGINHPVIITVLGSTYDGRFSDMELLASSTLSYLRNN